MFDTSIFSNALDWARSISTDQWATLVLALVAVSLAVKLAGKAIKIAACVAAVLFALHFFAPDLYATIIGAVFGR